MAYQSLQPLHIFNIAKYPCATNRDSNFGWGRVNASKAVNYLFPYFFLHAEKFKYRQHKLCY